jgi:rfaE bifunctional protein nucleotidyltransferase chain/domain
LSKIFSKPDLQTLITRWRTEGKKIVFTNGCFDIIHRGHVEYLEETKKYGDVLVLGLNSDDSVRRLKGKGRPFVCESDRAYILSHFSMVDAVCIFDEDTPLQLIHVVEPDVLVKGGDYALNEIVGRDVVELKGGKVVAVPLIRDKSTTGLIEKIKHSEL